jgi:hypothetical protein
MPWLVELNGKSQGKATTREAAIRVVDKPYRNGRAVIFQDHTGEEWTRNRGSWNKTREPSRKGSAA